MTKSWNGSMTDIDAEQARYVRTGRWILLAIGFFVSVAFGGLTFCLVASLVGLLNFVVPHLPWIPKDRSVEPVIETAWFIGHIVTCMGLLISLTLFVFSLKTQSWQHEEE